MPNQYGIAECNEFIDAVKEFPVMFGIFGEANSWIKDDVFALNSSGKRLIQLHRDFCNYLCDNIVVDCLCIHVFGMSTPMHQGVFASQFGNCCKHFGISCSSADVVNDCGSSLNR